MTLEEADHAARGTGELRGLLRVAMSSSFGVREVIPRLPKFMQTHPNLRIDLLLDDRHQDLVADGVDVALRFGALADSSATARRIGAPPRVLIASPAYLKYAGIPKQPSELEKHTLIVGPGGRKPSSWYLKRDGHASSVRVEGRLTVASNEAAIAAAIAGLGIASTALWGCRADLAHGRLVQVLANWDMEPVQVHAVFPAARAAKPAARAFADYLTKSLSD